MLQRYTLPAMTLAATLLTTGCVVAPQPVWLTDSSGFIAPCSDGSVVHYDLERKATRQLSAPSEIRTARVAVSPDGRLVAIPAAAWGPNSRVVAITIIQLSDGSVHANEMAGWGDQQAAREVKPASAFWCPSGDRILITYETDWRNTYGRFAVYDVGTQQLTEMRTPPPAAGVASALNVSPFPPDGSGYLAISESGKKDEALFSFVDWDGWEHKIQITPELREKLEIFGRQDVPEHEKKRGCSRSDKRSGREEI
jgi:hypothetical protein